MLIFTLRFSIIDKKKLKQKGAVVYKRWYSHTDS